MKKVCVITGTRAEYGILKPLIAKINDSNDTELQLVVTGMHLSPEFGHTYVEIIQDGFPIAEFNEMLLSSDTSNGITKSVGLGIIGFADIYTRMKPDMVVVLGDRFEILSAVTAAMIQCIPVAHLHGGELTEGCIDESIRHAVTKMSNLHFTSTPEYRDRVIQLGEQPEKVFYTGALGVENAKSLKLMTREELVSTYGNIFENNYFMVTFHPVTLDHNTAEKGFNDLLSVIKYYKEYNYVFTYANSDASGSVINNLINQFVSKNDNTKVFKSLGQIGYLSALKYCFAVVGNSSSGIIEAPSFGVPTINIGDRQKGRIQSSSIINCGYSYEDIFSAFEKSIDKEFKEKCIKCENPYENPGIKPSQYIFEILLKYLNENGDIRKQFYDINK